MEACDLRRHRSDLRGSFAGVVQTLFMKLYDTCSPAVVARLIVVAMASAPRCGDQRWYQSHPSKYLFSFQIFNHSKPSNTCNVNFSMDPSNSYFIHHSDHPSHLLIPIKLNGANYSSWSKSMIHALTAKNKIGFINGSIEQPSEKDQPTEYALWNQCNSMILSWLTHSVEPDLAKGVIHAKTAYQVWEDFKDQFSQKNAPAIYQIKKSLASFSQGTMIVSTYFTKLKGLWDELDTYRALPTCNQMKAHDEQREEDRLMQFLMGLHDTYNVVRTNILMMSPLPNVR
ncbi:hypothetical protein RJ640_005820 [Escallonia rubra]|uniref:Retrotransposon Copia-like N-terminal domain-containing protein n=1 Tax=Escallonia rubra TaxID=112253 RepID=A0AA88QNQ8_9ASTE|nr:hypothetical protein RJ640_005820 [Escallonia rubra]